MEEPVTRQSQRDLVAEYFEGFRTSDHSRILATLIYALRDRGQKRGVGSLCIGTGMGIAMGIELV